MAKKAVVETPAIGALTTIDPAMLANIVAALTKAQGQQTPIIKAAAPVKAQGEVKPEFLDLELGEVRRFDLKAGGALYIGRSRRGTYVSLNDPASWRKI